MDKKKEIKIMIVGDFLIFRNGLKLLLETEKKIKFVGEAANLNEAANLTYKVKPDVLLVDSSEMNDKNFNSFLTSQTNYIPTIVLTNTKSDEETRKYLLLGVDGLVSKEQTAEVLFKAIEQVGNGDIWFERKVLGDIIKGLVNEKKSLPEKLYSYNCAILTAREQEVLTLLCQGMKNKVIADNLFITETTVRHHLNSIFEKLNVSNRLELVVYAFKEKLVKIPVQNSNFLDV